MNKGDWEETNYIILRKEECLFILLNKEWMDIKIDSGSILRALLPYSNSPE